MSDTTVEAPELTAEEIHHVDDPSFHPETVALVTGAASAGRPHSPWQQTA